MTSIWHPYHSWECFGAGMYNYSAGPSMDEGKELYRAFLSDTELFASQTERLITEWPISCEHFLTKEAMNKIAWIGQASMCIHSGLSRKYRGGFHLLTNKQKEAANAVAWMALKKWQHEHAKKNGGVHCQLEGAGLFG